MVIDVVCLVSIPDPTTGVMVIRSAIFDVLVRVVPWYFCIEKDALDWALYVASSYRAECRWCKAYHIQDPEAIEDLAIIHQTRVLITQNQERPELSILTTSCSVLRLPSITPHEAEPS